MRVAKMAVDSSTLSMNSGTRLVPTPADPVKKSHVFLAEKFPPAKVRHKPLSILRQEARRALDQYLDADFPNILKAERDRLIEDVLGEAVGFGPLEEHFRDESVKEILILAFNKIILRKAESWYPSSASFRTASHLNSYLKRVGETGETYVPGRPPYGAFDVRLANGFRAVGVLPPDVMNVSPMVNFVRTEQAGTESLNNAQRTVLINKPIAMVTGPEPESSIMSMSATTRTVSATPSQIGSFSRAAAPSPAPSGSPSRVGFADSTRNPMMTPGPIDLQLRLQQKVTAQIVRKCAAAGVLDLKVIPKPELQRIIFAHVEEVCSAENFRLTDQMKNILTLEILTGMRG